MSGEQRVRGFLFYLSLGIFLIGLPFILSFALSYKFNPRTLKFTKTGLIAIKTQPQGASVYLEGKLLNEKSPTTINELLPGKYNIRLELEHYYPWFSEVGIDAGKVTRLDKIILFPLRPDIKHLNKAKISYFWVDDERIYYINQEEDVIYRSNLEGENFKEIGILPADVPPPRRYKISPDKEKLLCFNAHQIAIVYIEPQNRNSIVDQPVILDYSSRKIDDVFWHSNSYHLIVITSKNIEAQEAKSNSPPVNLVNLNKRNIAAYYDSDKDMLYFLDSQKGADGKLYDNVYRLDLSTKLYPFLGINKTGN